MFHEPVLDHKLYIQMYFIYFNMLFLLDHASIVLFPNKILNWYWIVHNVH